MATLLGPGSVIALYGPVGAGKTTLVKALAKALGVSEVVTSPSFTLISEYPGRYPLYHIDLYRIRGTDEAMELGIEEYLHGNGVTVIEWADRAAELLPNDVLSVAISLECDGSRRIRIDPGETE